MALPSSGSISIDDIKAELGITGALDLTDSRVRTLAGIASGSITLPNDLWGKAARTVTIQSVYRFISVGGRLGQGYDQITFSIRTSDGATPSSYSWGGAVGGTAATAVFRSSTYDQSGYVSTGSDIATCTVVVAGTSYYLAQQFTYNYGDLV